ncbi:MAG TPA: hypothetical protein VFP29_10105 [Methyloceanibacter sp.]|jgi:hypothetical protein|nr:hypothetical protein [Methyloceanibacter sp.]
MRDIRGDLKDRAEALELEIKASQARFDELIERLKQEHESRVTDLKSELDAVKLLMGLEQRRLSNGVPPIKPQPQGETARPQAEAPRAPAQAQPPRPSQPEVGLRRAV